MLPFLSRLLTPLLPLAGNLATEGTNANENELNFGFTIFVHDAVATETFEVGVGVLIGTTKVWTSNHTVTVLAGSDVPAGAAPASLTVSVRFSQK